VARVLPDVAGLDKEFDYLVPPELAAAVTVGTRVRVGLHGRRVGGWVMAVGGEPPPGVALRPLAKVTGLGPPPELVELAAWAAWRWAGRRRALLATASPPTAVRSLPASPRRAAPDGDGAGARGAAAPPMPSGVVAGLAEAALAQPRAVLRLPPACDAAEVALVAARRGPVLVITPAVAAASALAVRFRRAGLPVALHPRGWALGAAGASVVGARAAAWAPVGGLAAVVVLDEHDEALQEERNPTWHARDVAVERAARAGVPCVLVSPCPSLEALAWGPLLRPSRTEERAGWPVVEVVDMTREDRRRAGPWSAPLVRLLRSGARVACVLNRTGRATLLACAACGALTRCERCEAAVEDPGGGRLRCRRCGLERPVVCQRCGSAALALRRRGVTRAAQELTALAGTDAVEVSARAPVDEPLPDARLYVGTEAVLHRVPDLDAVAFLDLDQELLAPRYRAAEQALALLARAARLVGGRAGGGRLLVQTSLPRHEVLDAALHADPGRLAASEARRREELGFPPARALALVSGPGAAELVAALAGGGAADGVEVLGPADDRWLLRADTHRELCDALARAPRPSQRVRVEVDPLRV